MAEVMEIELARRDGADVRIQVCRLPMGARVNDALRACGLEMVPGRLGIFGRVVQGDEPLQAGDRVEIYEPLPQDPKAARRERVRRARRG